MDCGKLVHAEGIEPPCLKEAPGYSREDAIVHNVQNGGEQANRTPILAEPRFSRPVVSPSTVLSKNLLPDFYATPYLLYQNRSGSGNRVVFQPFG